MKKWAADFKRGRESLEDYAWSGRPIDATNDENVMVVHTLVMCNRQDLRGLFIEVRISYGAVQS